ncbi:MAG TPA: alanine racemase [Polyangiaceae bacterium LLY-WYZ-15_(1-7)]|nr:alanine racemase [Polyangiaceae bacterium LLY-WYZ-15_(1-7)]
MTAAPDQTLVLRPRLQRADEALRPTRAEIDLEAIAHNYRVVSEVAGPAKVLAVVKADAYGHGVVPVARRLQQEGARGLCVALAEEGLELREAGIHTDIVVLNGAYGHAHGEVLAAGLTPVVYDIAQVEALAAAAGGRAFGVHLKVDTGMARLGVPLAELGRFLERFGAIPGARIDGLMTHLACADSDDGFTAEQLQRFTRAQHVVRAHGHRPKVLHAANSAATFRHPSSRYDLVRCGIALFGFPNAPGVEAALRPAMRLRSEVVALRWLEPGAPVGYDGTFRAARRTLLATIPVGYGDGLMRMGSNRGAALLRGRRAPIVGNISMDLTTLDVTDVPGVAVGDEAVLFGSQRGPDGELARIDATEVAEACGTIPYEVLCAISRRVPRFYGPGPASRS